MAINSRFISRAWAGSTELELSKHHLILSDIQPGNCVLTVKAVEAIKVNAALALELGWGDSVTRVFLGIVEQVQSAEPGYLIVHCRELTTILARPLAIALRHPTVRQVIDEVATQTGLTFVLPDKPYCDTAIPCFYADTSGYGVLDNIGRAFQITDFTWQQQGNGAVYLGSWADSFWAGRTPALPSEYMDGQNGNTATMPAMPKLRPQVEVMLDGARHRLSRVEFKDTQMTISWG